VDAVSLRSAWKISPCEPIRGRGKTEGPAGTSRWNGSGLAVPVALWLAWSSRTVGTVGDADIPDASRTEDWLAFGFTHSGLRYSPFPRTR
jgi:hypothetical protein